MIDDEKKIESSNEEKDILEIIDKEKVPEISVLRSKEDAADVLDKVSSFNKEYAYTIFREIGYPMTVIYEKSYVDKLYRNTYYTYFSNKHFDIPRECKRLIIFRGEFEYENFFEEIKSEMHQKLEEALVGSIVIKPVPVKRGNCSMGRTLLNPLKMNIPPCYLRTTKFTISVLGCEYSIEAFPFSGQDGEIMTCAETCVWEILEYFGTRYANYHTILPEDILHKINEITQERVLPSGGLTFLQISSAVKAFGFEPRIYARKSYEKKLPLTKLLKAVNVKTRVSTFRRCFHYYIESGIPLIVALGEAHNEGHTVVCIGHGQASYDLRKVRYETFGSLKVMDTYQLYDDYVIMDDNYTPYRVEPFDSFLKQRWPVQYIGVPLYKHIYLEADNANAIVTQFLNSYADDLVKIMESMGLMKYKSEPLVMRLFITASRNFKQFRVSRAESISEKTIYSYMEYPKFIWVCEFSPITVFRKEKKVIGELVLDATGAEDSGLESIIGIRIGSHNGFRYHFERLQTLFERLEYSCGAVSIKYPLYRNNLKPGGNSNGNN